MSNDISNSRKHPSSAVMRPAGVAVGSASQGAQNGDGSPLDNLLSFLSHLNENPDLLADLAKLFFFNHNVANKKANALLKTAMKFSKMLHADLDIIDVYTPNLASNMRELSNRYANNMNSVNSDHNKEVSCERIVHLSAMAKFILASFTYNKRFSNDLAAEITEDALSMLYVVATDTMLGMTAMKLASVITGEKSGDKTIKVASAIMGTKHSSHDNGAASPRVINPECAAR